MKFLIPILVLITTTAHAQVRMPSSLQKRSGRMSEMDIGQTVRVYKEALIVDDLGRAWINKSHIYDTKPNRYKELEVTRLRSGYAVKVHYGYKDIRGYKVRTYPKWERSYVSSYLHAPVKMLSVKKPPQPKASPYAAITAALRKPYQFKPRYIPPPNYGQRPTDYLLDQLK